MTRQEGLHASFSLQVCRAVCVYVSTLHTRVHACVPVPFCAERGLRFPLSLGDLGRLLGPQFPHLYGRSPDTCLLGVLEEPAHGRRPGQGSMLSALFFIIRPAYLLGRQRVETGPSSCGPRGSDPACRGWAGSGAAFLLRAWWWLPWGF